MTKPTRYARPVVHPAKRDITVSINDDGLMVMEWTGEGWIANRQRLKPQHHPGRDDRQKGHVRDFSRKVEDTPPLLRVSGSLVSCKIR